MAASQQLPAGSLGYIGWMPGHWSGYPHPVRYQCCAAAAGTLCAYWGESDLQLHGLSVRL